MFYSNERIQLRKLFFDTWDKYQDQFQQRQAIEPLEQQILQVMLDHPEYHALLSQADRYLDKDYYPEFGETNPFLHMSLHLGIREQVSTNRPTGISSLYQQLLVQHHGQHLRVEHLMMDILAEQIWQAQRDNTLPNEQQFLQHLTQLLVLGFS